MSKVTTLTSRWAAGMRSDLLGEVMPPNSAINMLNMIPGTGLAPCMLRNGWGKAYTSASDFTGFSASSSSISAVAWAPFNQPDQCLIAIDQSGRIIRVTVAGVGSLLSGSGTGAAVQHQPWFHKGVLYIGNSLATGYPWTVTSAGTAAAMSGTVPYARTGASWGEYLLMSNGGDPANSYTINPRRTWFSDVGGTTFTMSNNSYHDWPEEVIKTVPLTNAIVAFGYRECWMLRGTTPPPNSDLIFDHLWAQGAIDPNTVKKWNGSVVYANADGVFLTDTTANPNLAKKYNVQRDYQQDFESFTSGWTAAGGLHGDFYILTVCNGSGVEQFTWVFDLAHERAFRFKGFPTKMYAEAANPGQASTISSTRDLLFGLTTMSNVGRMQPCFSAGANDFNGVDANSVVIDWELHTALYRLGTNEVKRFRRAFFSYDWDNTAAGTIKTQYNVTNNPTSGPQTGLTTVTTFPTGLGRQPVFVNSRGRWISLRISNTTPGSSAIKNFSLYGIDLEYHPIEGSRSSTA